MSGPKPEDVTETAPAAPRFSRAVWAILGVTLTYMGVALVASLTGGSGEFLLYLAVMALLVAVVGRLAPADRAPHRRPVGPVALGTGPHGGRVDACSRDLARRR